MAEYKLEFDLQSIKELQEEIKKRGYATKETFPALSASVNQSAKYIQNVWSNYATGNGGLNGVDPIEKPINPKNLNMEIQNRGDFESAVVSNSKQLAEVQNGSNPVYYDMKQTHPYGKRSRVNKKGIPYLIIPFRWGTPNGKGTERRWNNVISQKEYETFVKGFEMSKTKSTTHVELNAKGIPQDRAEYTWKTRLKAEDSWDDRATGMVRMEDAASGKSSYFTFRVISAKSPTGTWLYWRDGKNAVDMMGALTKTVQPGVEKIIESGLKADLGI